MSSIEYRRVAKTILEQIETGVKMALGMRELAYTENSLQFSANRRDKIQILLDWDDTYTITVWRGNLINLRKIKEIENIYASQLNEILLSLDSEEV